MSEIYFSIIIPMYNQEKYIARCLDSILAQSMRNMLEIIVVDDGSTDSGLDIVNSYVKIYSDMIKVITQPNKGPGGARNTGVRNAVGNYVWFVDGDDTIKQESLADLHKMTLRETPDIVMFDMDEVDSEGNLLIHSYTYESDNCGDVFSPKEHKDVLGSIHSAWNRIILREFYQNLKIDYPDRLYFEDLMTIPKILCQAKKILYIRRSYYNYYQNAGSIMHQDNIEKYKDIVAVMDDLSNFFMGMGLDKDYGAELEYMIIFHAYLMVSARIIKRDFKNAILKEIRNYVRIKWPHYHKNAYIKRLSIKHKLSLRCIDCGFYLPIYYVLNRKGN